MPQQSTHTTIRADKKNYWWAHTHAHIDWLTTIRRRRRRRRTEPLLNNNRTKLRPSFSRLSHAVCALSTTHFYWRHLLYFFFFDIVVAVAVVVVVVVDFMVARQRWFCLLFDFHSHRHAPHTHKHTYDDVLVIRVAAATTRFVTLASVVVGGQSRYTLYINRYIRMSAWANRMVLLSKSLYCLFVFSSPAPLLPLTPPSPSLGCAKWGRRQCVKSIASNSLSHVYSKRFKRNIGLVGILLLALQNAPLL